MDKPEIDESSSLEDKELVLAAERIFLEMDRLEEPQMDEMRLTTLYSEFPESDSNLAQEGIEDYQRVCCSRMLNDINCDGLLRVC